MLVKCRCHGSKIDRDTAFKVTNTDKNGKKVNSYFCSEEIYEEYCEIIREREERDKIPKIIFEIMDETVPYSLFKAQVVAMYDEFPSEDMLKYFDYRRAYLHSYINRKEFTSPRAKANYLLAILRSELKDWVDSRPETVAIDRFEFEPIKYRPKKRKPPLEEYEDGDDEI